jgi:cobalt/nickel transport system permease protein
MGLAGSATACILYRWLKRWSERTALFAAGWFSVNVPAALLATALGLQPLIAHADDGSPLFFPFGLSITLPAVMIPHAVVGVGEGLLTVFVLQLLMRLRGDILK